MEDLVLGNGCDDGTGPSRNPVAKFVDHMLRDRSQREQEEFRQHRPRQELNSRHEPVLQTQRPMMPGMQGKSETFLRNPPREMGTGLVDPLEEDLDEYFHDLNEHGGPQGISPQVPPQLLGNYIKAFIDSSKHQQVFQPETIPELTTLSPGEKERIGKRTHNLAQQLMSNQSQQFVDSQVNSFLHSFGPREFDPEMMAKEFSALHLHPSEEDFEKFYREANGPPMVQEFLEFERNQHFERIFQQERETQKWVDEFEGKRPIEQVKSSDEELRDISRAINQNQDPKFQQSKFSEFLSGISDGKLVVRDNQLLERPESEVWADEFQKESSVPDTFDPETWAKEWERFQETMDETWLQDYDDFQRETDFQKWMSEMNQKEYVFTDPENNPYLGHANPYEKGLELFNDGRLSQAILAFEAELLKNPQNSKCWHSLGQTHAENDKDEEAILALKKAVECDVSNLDAKMALAVSYTNDLTREKALDVLMDWIQNNPQYAHLQLPPEVRMEFTLYHNAVSDIYMAAARMNPANPDPDVQTGLGLLFNLSRDYERAVDCFKAALSMRPTDYLLWNKLGATLANSGQSEEALGCYFKALSIKPNYVRARSNLGISYMALKEYQKAAVCFLGALSMHPTADHMWHNLQMVLSFMGRDDLIDFTVSQDLDKFRSHFQF